MSKVPLYSSGCIATERQGDDVKGVQDFYLHVKDTIWNGLSYVCRVLSTGYSEMTFGSRRARSGFQDFSLKDGSSHGWNLAVTVFVVPFSLDSGRLG